MLVIIAAMLPQVRPAAADFEYRVVRDRTYVRRDAGDQTSDIYLPIKLGPLPGILMVHGGAWAAGHKNHAAWHARRLAQRGYAVMSINYRLAPRHPFPAQLEDCQAALSWMVEHAAEYGWDVDRLGAYGYSAGGHLACLLGLTQAWPADDAQQGVVVSGAPVDPSFPSARTDDPPAHVQLRAVVAGGAPCNFENEPDVSRRLAYWLGGTRQAFPDVYRRASPLAFAAPSSPAVFFYHGEQDAVVPLSSPQRLFKRLQRLGVATQLHVVPQAGHLAAYLDSRAFELSVDFLDRQLRSVRAE